MIVDSPTLEQTPRTTARDVAVAVDHVSKVYPNRGLLQYLTRTGRITTEALHDICLNLREGEAVGLLGPNGAGKTTLLKIIANMLYPSSGTVRIYGQDVCDGNGDVRRKLGLVTSDERSFYWRLTGRQNLQFFATLYGLNSKQARTRVDELFEVLDLMHAADRPFHQYSSGMKQKMAIARGLLTSPAVVLYDEPTRAVDLLSAKNIRTWLKKTWKQWPKTVHLIATNQLGEAQELCDRVLILNRGRVVKDGTIAEIRQSFQEHSIHRITYTGQLLPDSLHPDPATGILSVSVEAYAPNIVLQVNITKDSDGLSRVLWHVLAVGGVISKVEYEEVSFDEAYCSIVLDDQKRLAMGGAQ